ncbi:hypothetical protein [Nakamurella aerolata]|uniref:Uncharacterized protein n=1 Tax=Nakamurella aerolata TaxID=1656892 RepID=A0A849AJD5_9ACTN|nr:hypothetical protein [Nakamurella aerolata]NNG36922.1 hypothetical protein [Nakamurella aerolata]
MSIWASRTPIGWSADYGKVKVCEDSHRYPDYDGGLSEVEVASIPAWCVPGHEDQYESEAVGPWLRLTGIESVVLDEQAVRVLCGQLCEWLAQDKVRPPGDAS